MAASLKSVANAAKPMLTALVVIGGGAIGAAVGKILGETPGSTGIGVVVGVSVGAGLGALIGNIAFVVLSSLAILIIDHGRGESDDTQNK